MTVGFRFTERMSGYYRLLRSETAVDDGDSEGDERSIEFTALAQAPSLWSFLRNPRATLEGEIVAEGLADRRAIQGTLELPLLTRGKLIYEFTFVGDDGKTYRYRGDKTVDPLRLAETLTRLDGQLFDETDRPIARSEMRFDLTSDLVPFLRSWRASLA